MNPKVIVLSGPPLTGKTAVARELARITGFPHFDNDIARQAIFPNAYYYKLPQGRRFHYMAEAYRAIVEAGLLAIEAGSGAILTGTFSRPEFKRHLLFAVGENPCFALFELSAADAEIQRRINARIAENPPMNSIRSMDQYREALGMFRSIDFGTVMKLATDGMTPVEIAEAILARL